MENKEKIKENINLILNHTKMKIFTTIKTGYKYSNNKGWEGSYYKIIAIDEGKIYAYNVFLDQYDEDYPIKEYLRNKGFEEFYPEADIYGQIKRNDIKYYKFHTIEDIKRDIK